MEWVETTAKTVEDAKDLALDRLHVTADEAEFEVLEEPKAGLFGRLRGQARVRARVRPTPVRPKRDRRNRQRSSTPAAPAPTAPPPASPAAEPQPQQENRKMSNDEAPQERQTVSTDEVAEAARQFMAGLVEAFGAEGAVEVEVDDADIDVRVTGTELGLLVGPGGRTLAAVQDLARVASQRRLSDHDTRLRIDVGDYRERRRQALEKFAVAVANQVLESGVPKALEPMSSADRKIVHDALSGVEGVSSRSEGDDPARRVVISPD